MDSSPTPGKRPTPKLKKVLRIVTLTAVVLFLVLQIAVPRYVRYRASRPVVIRLKSEEERARLSLSADAYPCLLIERLGGSAAQPLKASIRQCSPALHNNDNVEQYEVDLRSGLFLLRKTDLFVPDTMPLALMRGYHAWDAHPRAFGIGGNHAYDIFPFGDRFPYTYMELALCDGRQVHYSRISEGTSYADFVSEHRGTPPTIFEKSQIRWNVDHWDMTFHDGTLYRFPDAYYAKRPVDGALIGMRNPNGDEIKFVRDARHNLTSLTSPHAHQIQFTYDSADRIIRAADNAGHVIGYSYDPYGKLTEVREDGRLLTRYLYTSRLMTAVQDSNGSEILVIEHKGGRTSRIIQQWTSTYHFDYAEAPDGQVQETTVTDPSGKKTVFKF
jgi:YD repeat-containing protein